jgi:NAD(P)-dependent dehydrogenase (short-subunit alcohol dehydrogenase family)
MTPQELFVIAAAVAFPASKEAGWITGSTVDADGKCPLLTPGRGQHD